VRYDVFSQFGCGSSSRSGLPAGVALTRPNPASIEHSFPCRRGDSYPDPTRPTRRRVPRLSVGTQAVASSSTAGASYLGPIRRLIAAMGKYAAVHGSSVRWRSGGHEPHADSTSCGSKWLISTGSSPTLPPTPISTELSRRAGDTHRTGRCCRCRVSTPICTIGDVAGEPARVRQGCRPASATRPPRRRASSRWAVRRLR
jgi:hypothetical protein